MKEKIRCGFLHLSQSMWGGYLAPGMKADPKMRYAKDYVRCDRKVLHAIEDLLQRRKYNTVMVDLGDTMIFPSHPELAIKGSWTPEEMKAELARMRGMGFEIIPKLNFSACHDAWLKEYGRMLSTPKYYEVVRDLINDVFDVFGPVRYFHLGMDEESALMQRSQDFIIVRQGELLWHDVYWMFDLVGKHGAQPIVFTSSFGRSSPKEFCNQKEFCERMPKSVIQNFGMYGSGYDLQRLQNKSLPEPERNPYGLPQWFNDKQAAGLKIFEMLADNGYKVLSCSSNWLWPQTVTLKNPKAPVTGRNRPQDPKSCAWLHKELVRRIAPENLLGEMIVPWVTLMPDDQYFYECGINQLADALDEEA